MAINITRAIVDATGRLFERNGLILLGAVLIAQFAYTLGLSSLLPTMSVAPESIPTAGSILGAVFLLLGIGGLLWLSVVSLRVFYIDETQTIPRSAYTENIGRAAVHLLVAGALYFLAVTFGFVLLIVPGIFLAVSLFFFDIHVAVRNRNFVDALGDSWTTTKGNRWPVLGLFLVTTVLYIGFTALDLALDSVGGLVHWVMIELVATVLFVFVLAVTARAFVQLQAEEKRSEPAA